MQGPCQAAACPRRTLTPSGVTVCGHCGQTVYRSWRGGLGALDLHSRGVARRHGRRARARDAPDPPRRRDGQERDVRAAERRCAATVRLGGRDAPRRTPGGTGGSGAAPRRRAARGGGASCRLGGRPDARDRGVPHRGQPARGRRRVARRLGLSCRPAPRRPPGACSPRPGPRRARPAAARRERSAGCATSCRRSSSRIRSSCSRSSTTEAGVRGSGLGARGFGARGSGKERLRPWPMVRRPWSVVSGQWTVTRAGCAGRRPCGLHLSSFPRKREPSHHLTRAAWIPAFAGMTPERSNAPPTGKRPGSGRRTNRDVDRGSWVVIRGRWSAPAAPAAGLAASRPSLEDEEARPAGAPHIRRQRRRQAGRPSLGRVAAPPRVGQLLGGQGGRTGVWPEAT